MPNRRVLLAKPGLDGHDRGIHVVARGLRDAGYEVIITGLRTGPETIVKTAVEEDVAAIGLSILSGSHIPVVQDVIDALERANMTDVPLIVGGTVPPEDRPTLLKLGVGEVFDRTSTVDDIVEWLDRHL